MSKTIAVFGVGPGLGRSVARRFGREGFQFPLDLLLRTPVALIRQVLPRMLERGDGAVLFGLPVSASVPVPPFGNIATAAAAARPYLRTLHADLADTGVYAGPLQISDPVRDSDAGNYVLETYGAANLPEPQNPDELADSLWDLYIRRETFDELMVAA